MQRSRWALPLEVASSYAKEFAEVGLAPATRFSIAAGGLFAKRSMMTSGVFVMFVAMLGCGTHVPDFQENLLFANRIERESGESLALARVDVRACVNDLFGTPDHPKWPGAEFLAEQLDMDKVRRAAGAVGRAQDGVERGLWRKHCATCHGITGDGAGPTAALLAPYPRDFRRGSFKFKSTPIGSRPTRADLKKVVENGIPGTSMPSFHALTRSKYFANDIDDLVEYVIYLAVRGEVERKLLTLAGLELDESERLYDPALSETNPQYQVQRNRIAKVMNEVVKPWTSAESRVTLVGYSPADNLADSIERGKEIFNSATTACASCHGSEGKGDGKTQDFDEWTKDWTIRAGIDPMKPEEWKPLKKLGALKPVKDMPRNFHLGAFRGGNDPREIYLRIVNGIEGTPMPAVARQPDNPQGLSESQIEDLVNFVLSLSDDPVIKQGAN